MELLFLPLFLKGKKQTGSKHSHGNMTSPPCQGGNNFFPTSAASEALSWQLSKMLYMDKGAPTPPQRPAQNSLVGTKNLLAPSISWVPSSLGNTALTEQSYLLNPKLQGQLEQDKEGNHYQFQSTHKNE